LAGRHRSMFSLPHEAVEEICLLGIAFIDAHTGIALVVQPDWVLSLMRNSCFTDTPFVREIKFKPPYIIWSIEPGVANTHWFLNMARLVSILHSVVCHPKAFSDLATTEKCGHSSFLLLASLGHYDIVSSLSFFSSVEEKNVWCRGVWTPCR
jgi:hypothetical protein